MHRELTKLPSEDIDKLSEGRGDEGAVELPQISCRVRIGTANCAVRPGRPLGVLLEKKIGNQTR